MKLKPVLKCGHCSNNNWKIHSKNSNKTWQINFLTSQTHHLNRSSGIRRLICQGCIFHGPILCISCTAPRFLLGGCFQMALHRPGTGAYLGSVFLFIPACCFFPVLCFFGILDLVALHFFLNGLFFPCACLSASSASFTGVSVRIAVSLFFLCWLTFFLGPAFG